MARQTRNFFPNIINASHIEKIESYIKKEKFDKVPMVSSAINDKFDEGLLRGWLKIQKLEYLKNGT